MVLSNDTIQKIHDRYMAGETVSAIAKDVGLRAGHIYWLFRKNNLPKYRWISRERVVSLHNRYLLGDSIEDLAAEIGMSYGGLYYLFARDQLTIKESLGDGVINDVRRRNAEALYSRYMANETVHQIASSLGVTPNRIYNLFQTYNLPLKSLRSKRNSEEKHNGIN